MGLFLSLFRSKPLDSQMDHIHHDILQSESKKKIYHKIRRYTTFSYLVVTIVGGVVISFSLYVYQASRSRAWMNTAVSSTIFTFLVYFLLYILSRLCNYKIRTLDNHIGKQNKNLKQLFSKFMEEGSYKKVLQLRSKYDPDNRLFYDLDFDISGVKPKTILQNNPIKRITTSKKKILSNNSKDGVVLNTFDDNRVAVPRLESTNQNALTKSTNSFDTSKNEKFNSIVESSEPPFQIYKNRSWIDKIIDKLLGDGPENRNALICNFCHAHNGLVPPEDFLSITYRCYSCKRLHHPRKTISFYSKTPIDNTTHTSIHAIDSVSNTAMPLHKLSTKIAKDANCDFFQQKHSNESKISPLMDSQSEECSEENDQNNSTISKLDNTDTITHQDECINENHINSDHKEEEEDKSC